MTSSRMPALSEAHIPPDLAEQIPSEETTPRQKIEHLQSVMAAMPQVETPTHHHFADGVYVREMHCSAGTLIIGKVHKREHIFMLISGEMTLTGDGHAPRQVKAPFIVVSQPGVKRAGFAHTNCIVLNVHRTDSRDLDAIEAELVEPDEAALFDARNQIKPEKLQWHSCPQQ